jgi:hypothetical protein
VSGNSERGCYMTKKIHMEDRDCNSELLRRLYCEERISRSSLMKKFNVGAVVMDRWFNESNIIKRENGSIHSFDKNYFDQINSEEKAYWLGFIWCDGYILKRERKNGMEYTFKIALAEYDSSHLVKLKKSLSSSHPLRSEFSSSFNINSESVYLRLHNQYFCKQLYHRYGLVPHRTNTRNLCDEIPHELAKHFIRGVLDADGSIVKCYVQDKHSKYEKNLKNNVNFSTYEELLNYIQEYFYDAGLINYKSKYRKRHEQRDGNCMCLSYSGLKQVPKILDYLYGDAEVYLERKYEKYILIKNQKESERWVGLKESL